MQILDTLKDWQFFYGESGVDGGGMVALMNFREDGVTPYMLFFKDGVVEEKVVSMCSHYDMYAKGSPSIMHFILNLVHVCTIIICTAHGLPFLCACIATVSPCST